MESKELRIGNYIQNYNERQVVVNGATIVYFNTHQSDRNTTLIPIPLTEDWLIKFEFDRGNCGMTILYNKTSVTIEFEDNEFWLQSDEYLIEIKYVHQLQNLYFALTSEELILKKSHGKTTKS